LEAFLGFVNPSEGERRNKVYCIWKKVLMFSSKFQNFLSSFLDPDPINTDRTEVQSRLVYYAELPIVHVFLQLLMSPDLSVYRTEAEFLNEIQTKVTVTFTVLP
jgi:hypothetical protein